MPRIRKSDPAAPADAAVPSAPVPEPAPAPAVAPTPAATPAQEPASAPAEEYDRARMEAVLKTRYASARDIRTQVSYGSDAYPAYVILDVPASAIAEAWRYWKSVKGADRAAFMNEVGSIIGRKRPYDQVEIVRLD